MGYYVDGQVRSESHQNGFERPASETVSDDCTDHQVIGHEHPITFWARSRSPSGPTGRTSASSDCTPTWPAGHGGMRPGQSRSAVPQRRMRDSGLLLRPDFSTVPTAGWFAPVAMAHRRPRPGVGGCGRMGGSCASGAVVDRCRTGLNDPIGNRRRPSGSAPDSRRERSP